MKTAKRSQSERKDYCGVLHDGMPYDLIQGQGQGHGGPKVAKWPISKSSSSASLHVIKRMMNFVTPRQ